MVLNVKKKSIVAFLLALVLLSLTACSVNMKAKRVADEYCDMLKEKQKSITSIRYTGKSSEYGNSTFFDYKVKFNTGLERIGTVQVSRRGDDYVAVGMDMD